MACRFRYFILIVFISLGLICGCSPAPDSNLKADKETYNGLGVIEQAFRKHQSGFFVASSGTIENILSDDLKPPPHQRIILRLENGQTLLLLFNIDVCPRIADLAIGDKIDFRGRYLWNEKGGAIDYIHRDPAGRLAGGWIKHKGKTYR
ncbi:MAG: DUF3465 domain-containing protein [Candidatus Omnitrophica bacterium]|nr:DUF3465 domain-containing protein [Candidatus Omnitrophota bacterium]